MPMMNATTTAMIMAARASYPIRRASQKFPLKSMSFVFVVSIAGNDHHSSTSDEYQSVKI
jgi:hypothetical protein